MASHLDLSAVFSMTAGDSAGDVFGNTYLCMATPRRTGLSSEARLSGALLWSAVMVCRIPIEVAMSSRRW